MRISVKFSSPLRRRHSLRSRLPRLVRVLQVRRQELLGQFWWNLIFSNAVCYSTKSTVKKCLTLTCFYLTLSCSSNKQKPIGKTVHYVKKFNVMSILIIFYLVRISKILLYRLHQKVILSIIILLTCRYQAANAILYRG